MQPVCYAPGTKVTLRLDPASNLVFHHWDDCGGLVPKDAPSTLTVIMDGHKWIRLCYDVPPTGTKK